MIVLNEMHSASFADFISMARSKHQHRYDYSKSSDTFVNYTSFVVIICTIHGDFTQQASVHAHKGHGCVQCRNAAMSSTTKQFVEKATAVHGHLYDYSRVHYKKNSINVEIGCPKHGYFWQTPASHIKQTAGCPECANIRIGRSRARSQGDFIEAAQAVHGLTYDYTDAKYVQQYQRVDILCHRHGMFSQLPKVHLKGAGCPKCADERGSQKLKQRNAKSFQQRAQAVHGDLYGYKHVEYLGYKKDVVLTCKIHGYFSLKPVKHLQGQGCPTCSSSKMYSEKACDWLDYVAKQENILIVHARNGQEWRVPGTNYKADGYCATTNTVYEFYGDFWHGNLDRYPADKYNGVCKATMGELHAKTMHREERIRGLGYNVVTMWEHSFDKMFGGDKASRKRKANSESLEED